MAINFPNSPANNQLFIDSTTGNQYVYDSNSTKWKSYASQATSISLMMLDYGYVSETIVGTVLIDYGSLT